MQQSLLGGDGDEPKGMKRMLQTMKEHTQESEDEADRLVEQVHAIADTFKKLLLKIQSAKCRKCTEPCFQRTQEGIRNCTSSSLVSFAMLI